MKVRRMIFPRTLCHERGGGIKVFVIFFIEWHYMAKIVKITKITKTLKGTPFHVLPLSCRRLLPLSRRGEKKRPMEK